MDSYRFDIEENDLRDAVDLYTLYKTNKTHSVILNAVNENPRAKLIPINHFNKDNNWDINLCWSNEEKETLGIKKKDNLMSLNEFNTFVDELIEDIKNYQEAIKCLED